MLYILVLLLPFIFFNIGLSLIFYQIAYNLRKSEEERKKK